MNKVIQNSKRYLWLIALVGIVHSCSKTEYTDYEKEPLNRITEYRVTNTQQELLGAIDNENNTITVYIPYYVGLEYLNAEIKLEPGAKLLDGNGQEINLDGGLDPVPVSADTVIQYTVAPDTGSRRTYTLVQKVLPHGDDLQVSYEQELKEGESFLLKPVNSPLVVIGNFNSSNSTAKFFLTDKATGTVYEDFIETVAMTPGSNGYALRVNVSPYALKGTYGVRVEHQGRSADLPDLKLFYADDPWATIRLTSAVHWTPGDTMRFGISVGSNTPTIYLKADRMYMKIRPNDAFPRPYGVFEVPETFPESMYNQEIEMEIVSQDRTHIAAVFPDIPTGRYLNNSVIYQSTPTYREDGTVRTQVENANIAFYVDFAEETGWGKGRIIATPSSIALTVLEKQ